MKLLSSTILLIAGSAALTLATFAGHASLVAYHARELAALPSGLLAVFMGCAAVHLYGSAYAALTGQPKR